MISYEDVLAYGYRKARAMGMSHHDAEDAAQVGAFRVSQREHTFDPSRDAWPLIQVIVRQSVHEHVRRVYARPDTPSDLIDYDAPTRDTTEETVLDALERDEVKARVHAALDALSGTRRQVVEYMLAGMSADATAERMRYTVASGRVRQLRREAFATMRAVLEVA